MFTEEITDAQTGVKTIREFTQEEIDALTVKIEAAKIAQRNEMVLTFAQLLIGLVTESWITEAEGEAWLTGTLPAPVLTLISTLPANEQFAAKARAIAPSVVLRNDSLVIALGAAQGKTPEQLDTFFRTYASA